MDSSYVLSGTPIRNNIKIKAYKMHVSFIGYGSFSKVKQACDFQK